VKSWGQPLRVLDSGLVEYLGRGWRGLGGECRRIGDKLHPDRAAHNGDLRRASVVVVVVGVSA